MTFSSPEPPDPLSRRGLEAINSLHNTEESIDFFYRWGVDANAFSLLGLAWRKDVCPMTKIAFKTICNLSSTVCAAKNIAPSTKSNSFDLEPIECLIGRVVDTLSELCENLYQFCANNLRGMFSSLG